MNMSIPVVGIYFVTQKLDLNTHFVHTQKLFLKDTKPTLYASFTHTPFHTFKNLPLKVPTGNNVSFFFFSGWQKEIGKFLKKKEIVLYLAIGSQ